MKKSLPRFVKYVILFVYKTDRRINFTKRTRIEEIALLIEKNGK